MFGHSHLAQTTNAAVALATGPAATRPPNPAHSSQWTAPARDMARRIRLCLHGVRPQPHGLCHDPRARLRWVTQVAPLVVASPAYLSLVWFPAGQRNTATSIANVANALVRSPPLCR